jgi:hypothetical protein
MASLFQSNAGAMHNPLLPAGDQTTASPFGFGGPQRASIPREPSSRTQQPIVTGTGMLGLKFKDGIMLAADTLGTARWHLMPILLSFMFFSPCRVILVWERALHHQCVLPTWERRSKF